jgi:lipoate-protein ligase A
LIAEFLNPPWRLLLSPPADGATNMAVDEAILQAVADESQPPTLRFYAWQPPCLSLGYAQPASDVDRERLRALGWDLVRRPTGGRAILHTDELTYSVVAPGAEPRVQGGVLESYRRLSLGLLAGLRRLGVPARAEADPPQPEGSSGAEFAAICFEVPSRYEITAGGRKLLGSAQMRRRRTVLQHGSLPLFGDLARICDGLQFESEEVREAARLRVRARALTVLESLPGAARPPMWAEAAAQVAAGFTEALEIEFVEGELSAEEEETAAALRRAKYGTDAWNLKVL